MDELKDLIGLLVTINIGVLASGLTLLAIYPAITSFVQQEGVGELFNSERQRHKLFARLGATVLTSGLGLLVLTGLAIWGVLVENNGSDPVRYCMVETVDTLSSIDRIAAWTGTGLSALSFVNGALAAWLIFKMTRAAA